MCTCQFGLLSAFVVAAMNASSCALPAELHEPGEVRLPLRTTTGATTYELRDASFAITGPIDVTLSSEDAPEALLLEQTLPAGDYLVALQPDWRLFDVSGDSPVELSAALVSENPIPFSIQPQTVTQVRYQFEIDDAAGDPGSGALEIAMAVNVSQSGPWVFTELMCNPAELADSAGEWLELQNTSEETLDLEGCILERDASRTTIDGSLEVAPGGVVTLANAQAPGFEPDYVYSSIILPNSALFELSLRCDGVLVDRVVVDPSTMGGAGIAASLSSGATSVSQNDIAAHWCDATAAYTSDLGTPGSVNPSCG